MCQDCSSDTEPKVAPLRRLKLWEMDSRVHCAIVGTCLSVGDLQRIVRKLKILVPDDLPDYSLHGFFVGAARGEAENKTVARHLHKILDRNHSASVGKANRLRDDSSLTDFWRTSLESGKIPGPFWAILTSPYASTTLKDRVYGDVHMLSHIEGATNRQGLLKSQEQEKLIGTLQDQVARYRHRHYTVVAEKGLIIEELEKKLLAKDALIARLQDQWAVLGGATELTIRNNHGEMLDALQGRLSEASRQTRELEQERKLREARISEMESRIKSLESEREEFTREISMLEEELGQPSQPVCANTSCPAAENGDLDLCGRCIVFIGGRSNQTPHFRSLVERYNGTFMHHDGGLDDGQVKLESLLSKADAVFFPVDCISHNASRDIKKFCKRDLKPFVPLPRSGYASFRRGLEETFALAKTGVQ